MFFSKMLFLSPILIITHTNLFSQSIGILHIDSVATFSIIEDSSFTFCNAIKESYLSKGKKLIDSLEYKYRKLLKESERTDGPFEYFERQEKEIQALMDTILKLENNYESVQNILNEAIYNFTIQEIKSNRKMIESRLAIHFLITSPPIYTNLEQSNIKIKNVTQEVINIINNSASFKENWLLFKTQIKLSE